jgi:hypothetical protein
MVLKMPQTSRPWLFTIRMKFLSTNSFLLRSSAEILSPGSLLLSSARAEVPQSFIPDAATSFGYLSTSGSFPPPGRRSSFGDSGEARKSKQHKIKKRHHAKARSRE